jgi:hypothetical protein
MDMSNHRSEMHREIVEALVSSKAVDFEAVGSVLSKYGARAALAGDAVGVIINWRVMDLCIPVDFKDLVRNLDLSHSLEAQVKG